MEPWVNVIVLPLFAFSSALVIIPAVSIEELTPAFYGILIALPVGKILGISLFGWISQRVAHDPAMPRLPLADLIAAGALGGIGFTVSLLLSELAFEGNDLLTDEAVLGVLSGSLISVIIAGILVSTRARHYRRRASSVSEPSEAATS